MADDHEKQQFAAAPSGRRQTRPWTARFTPPRPSRTLATLLTVLGVTSILAMLGYIPMDTKSISMRYHQWTGTCGPIHQGKCSPLRLDSPVPSSIDFQDLFPNLISPKHGPCVATWAGMKGVPCSDALILRDEKKWPEGGYKGDDLVAIMMDTCNQRCFKALDDAHNLLRARRCQADDTFILDSYSGSVHPDYLDLDVSQVMNRVREDADRLCDSQLWTDYGTADWRYCKLFMWQKFRIDTTKDANFEAVHRMISYADSADTKLERQPDGKVACGRCTLDYLNDALFSWEKGKLSTRDSMRNIDLPEYIRKLNEAGELCSESHAWESMIKRAVRFYQRKRLLPSDWKLSETDKTSSNLRVLMYGPSVDDYPLSALGKEMSHILDLQKDLEVDTTEIISHANCLLSLQEAYRLAGCHIHVDHNTLSSMMDHTMAARRSFYCDHGCAVRLNQFENTRCDVQQLTPNGRDLVQGYWEARKQRDNYCALFDPESADDSCARSIIAWGKEGWAFTGRPETPEFLADVDDALNDLRKAAGISDTTQEFGGDHQEQKVLGSGSEVLAAHLPEQWYDDPRYSVCSECVWKWIVGHNLNTTMDYMRTASSSSAYVELARKYYDTCTAVGANWLGEEPIGDDPVIWRVKPSPRGRPIRYLRSLKDLNEGLGHSDFYDEADPEGREEMAFPMDEETGEISGEPRPVNGQPGDASTLWHVLEAARGLEAERQDRFADWRRNEAEKRFFHDLKMWRHNWDASRHGRERYGRPEDQDGARRF